MIRFRLSHALILVGLVFLWLAAMRGASATLTAVAIFLTYCALVAASTVAVLGRVRRGPLGAFALVGWAYFLPFFVFASKVILECARGGA